MASYNAASAKAHLSEILTRVCEGENVLLTRRGKAVAKTVPIERTMDILGAGKADPNIHREVIGRDDWWRALPDGEAKDWYE